ncbi:MAG: transglutaminase-like [Herminiimonas sp.]|nr:transglutaminase-like [Herminiimonas sp.]
MPNDHHSDGALSQFLLPGQFVDSDHPAVVAFALHHAGQLETPREKAVALYHAVRDGLLYDPYRIDQSPAGYKASHCLEVGYGFCVTKAALLAAAGRAAGIPTRLGYADVRNHLTSARLRSMLGTDIFAFHGYTDMYLDGRWVKATPAFNLSLCEKAGILPLEFDGLSDSIFHPFDASGRRHMEYVRDRGVHADVPRDEIMAAWREIYPRSSGWGAVADEADFEKEAGADARRG